jgi:branched-chain amino acid transport system substrate-binding protein
MAPPEEVKSSAPRKTSNTTRLIVVLIVGLLIGVAAGYLIGTSVTPSKSAGAQTYTIGVATDLSGGGQDFGIETLEAAQMAVTELNAQMNLTGTPVEFKISSADTLTTTDGTLTAIQSLVSAGSTIILCHCWSGQVQAVQNFVSTNHVVVASVSSTSDLLAVPKAYEFRLLAPDLFQGHALSALLSSQGITKVVVMYRDDPYGQGISGVFKADFTAKGGTVKLDAYQPGLTDYATEVSVISSDVNTMGVAPTTAVLLIGFESEAVNIFGHARLDSVLPQVRWFSSEGIKGSNLLPPTGTAQIAAFETQVNLTGTFPQVAVPNNLTTHFLQAFQAKFGHGPTAYGLQAYDGLYLLANAILTVGKYDPVAVNKVLPTVAGWTTGASGPMRFDSNGDRASQDYVVWKVVNGASGYAFKDIGAWTSTTGELTFY